MKITTSRELYEVLQKKKTKVMFNSGIPALDRLVGYFSAGELTVISGKTAHGKTTLAITLTRNLADRGLNILWFSYEMATMDFLEKTKADGKIPYFYLPDELTPNRLSFVEEMTKQAFKIAPIHAVFIDHLHYLCDLSNLHLTIEISRVMRWLKAYAIKYQCVVFLIAHVQKLAEIKIKDLDNDHLRDASAIAQEADNVFFILRPDDTNKAILKITKNRRNGIRGKYIHLIKVDNFFEESHENKE